MIRGNSRLFTHNDLGELLQLLKLGDTACQALVVRVAVYVAPCLLSLEFLIFDILSHLLSNFAGF